MKTSFSDRKGTGWALGAGRIYQWRTYAILPSVAVRRGDELVPRVSASNGSSMWLKNSVEPCTRVVQLTERVRSSVFEDGILKGQPATACSVDHPEQRDVRERSIRVAASHITMDATKPNLFNLLAGLVGLRFPHRGLKRPPSFIDR